MCLTTGKMSKKRRIKKSRKKLEKASNRLRKESYRRKRAENGSTFEALFGKPKW